MNRTIFHSYLFILAPLLYQYQSFSNEISFWKLIFYSMGFLLTAIILSASIHFIVKNAYRTALLSSIIVFWFFLFDNFSKLMGERVNLSGVHKDLVPFVVWNFLYAVLIFWVVKSKKQFEKVNNYLNTLAVIFFIILITSIFFLKNKRDKNNFFDSSRLYTHVTENRFPNIYLVVLDSYAGNEALSEILHYDNSHFTNQLKKKNFLVYSGLKSNYVYTELSVSSFLNLKYHEYPVCNQEEGYSLNAAVVDSSLRLNSFYSILSDHDYVFRNLSLWPNLRNDDSNLNYQGLIDDYFKTILEMTIVKKLILEEIIVVNENRDRTRFLFERLKAEHILKPTFTYAHFLVPHKPYSFDENGSKPSLFAKVLNVADSKKYSCQAYIKQIQFINKKVLEVIESIERDDPNAVIIIQGDHGGRMLDDGMIDDIKLQTSVLCAINFGRIKSKNTSQLKTLVNVYRNIINSIFNLDYPMLPDEIYFSKSDNIYKVKKITPLLGH